MKHTLLLITLFCTLALQAQKKPITIDDFIKWKRIESTTISTNGKFVGYKLSPEKGNSTLVLHNIENGSADSLFRAGSYGIAFNGHFAIATVEPDFEAIRQLKLKKEKKENYPKDSLYLVDLKTFEHQYLDLVKSWKTPKTNGKWLAYLREEPLPEPESDTTGVDSTETEEKEEDFPAAASKASAKKDKDARTLVIYNLKTKKSYEYQNVKNYGFSENGSICYFYSVGDSTFEQGAYVFKASTLKAAKIDIEAKEIKGFESDTIGSQIAFIYTQSGKKAKKKVYELGQYVLDKESFTKVDSNRLKPGLNISDDYNLSFTENGERLFFGVSPRSKEYPEDSTILPEEKAQLDIWSHMDGRLQPQQLHELKRDQKRAYEYFFDVSNGNLVQVSDKLFESENIAEQNEGRYAIISDASPYFKERSWESPWPRDIYLKDLKKGTEQLLFEKFKGSINISPDGNYVYWFNMEEGLWWLMNLKNEKRTCLTADNKNDYVDIDDDHPMLKGSYGIGGWFEDDKFIFINTKNGFTAFDPTGKRKPSTFGKKGNLRERIIRINRDPFISAETGFYIEVFDTRTKEKSLLKSNYVANENDFILSEIQSQKRDEPYQYFNYYKSSENGELSLWRIESNQQYPDLFVKTNDGFKRLSNANPQQAQFKWYTTELVDYLTADGDSLQGILYKPENFDPNKKYPMIVYFYEKMSDYVNSYQTPRASYSTISRSFYCSNEYFVFVPDIVYSDGEPGQSALNCIVPGVLNVLQKHHYINPHKIALQGQSWGGYQTAHLITRCDLFACAMAGAPVSNMTSAYGGIRWGSGYNRAFQYEHGQSRIGGTLWNSTLDYIDNSPLFYANRVNTPLLMMHNDNDGAVPWYQGIEYFTALRRLDKEVWMLVYNNEEHNLRKRPNRVDLSYRMFGFFNYYLKGHEMPLWMDEGIPAIDKGKFKGY